MKNIQYKLCVIFMVVFILNITFYTQAQSQKKILVTNTSATLDSNSYKKVINNFVYKKDTEPNKNVFATEGWNTNMSESFEGSFPTGLWQVLVNTTNAYWGSQSYSKASGNWAAWCAAAGNQALPPSGNQYRDNMNTWMVYGPFNLSDASDASLSFWFASQTELNHDYFKCMASIDGLNYYGTQLSGNYFTWQMYNFDLKNVYTLGNVCGKSQVWIAFIFTSDNANHNYAGTFLDDILLQKDIASTNGTLQITVQNIDGTSTPLPGSDGSVQLYNNSNQLVSTQSTNSSGVVTFTDVSAGTGYYYKVYHTPNNPTTIFGQEYWGQKTGITITTGQTTQETFKRNMPYGNGVEFHVYNNSTNQEIPFGGSVASGIQLKITFAVVNPNFNGASNQTVKGRVVIDRDKASGYDSDQTSSSQSVSVGSSITFTYYFTPPQGGSYYRVTGTITNVNGTDTYTDGWAWGASPQFTVGQNSQLYSGQAQGSITGGASTSTNNFQSFSNSDTTIKPIQNVIPIGKKPIIPNPPNMKQPLKKQGSNEVNDTSISSIKIPSLMAPSTITNFSGLTQTSWIPPDPVLAVGPNYIVSCVNTDFGIFSKNGTLIKRINANNWFQNVLPQLSSSAKIFDPKIIFDHFNNRWIMSWLALDVTAKHSWYLISTSDDSDPNGTWFNFALPADEDGSSATDNWADYDEIGVDNQAIYITSNQFSFPGPFSYTKLRIIDKSQFYNNTGGSINWKDFWDFRDPDNKNIPVFTLRPSLTFGTPGVEYIVNSSPYMQGAFVTLWSISNILSSTPSISATNISTTGYSAPPNADQLDGGNPGINVGDDRLLNAVYKDGLVYTVHTISDGSGIYSRIGFLKINVSNKTA